MEGINNTVVVFPDGYRSRERRLGARPGQLIAKLAAVVGRIFGRMLRSESVLGVMHPGEAGSKGAVLPAAGMVRVTAVFQLQMNVERQAPRNAKVRSDNRYNQDSAYCSPHNRRPPTALYRN